MYNLMLGKKKTPKICTRNEMSQGLEIGLKQASEMNVFEGFEGLGGIPLHILPLGACPGGRGRGHRPVLLRPFQRKVSFWKQFSYNTFVLHSDLVCIAMQRDSSSQRFVTKKLWIFICIFVKCTEDSINHLLPLKFIKRSVLSVLC